MWSPQFGPLFIVEPQVTLIKEEIHTLVKIHPNFHCNKLCNLTNILDICKPVLCIFLASEIKITSVIMACGLKHLKQADGGYLEKGTATYYYFTI